MKQIFTFAAIAMMATTMWADKLVTTDLSQPTNPATITYNEDNHAWSETYNDAEQYKWVTYGNVMFSHLYGGYGSSYGGYYWDGQVPALGGDDTDYGVDEDGNVTGSNDWVTHAWGCMANGGVQLDENGDVVVNADGTAQSDADQPYIVSYWGYWGYGEQTNIIKFADDKAYTIDGVWVCNSPWAYYATVHGDGFARAFAEGDNFTIHAFGVAEDGTEKEQSFALVEYADDELNAANDWTFFDLKDLGKVKSVYFTVTSTDSGSYGNNTSNIFCLGAVTYIVEEGDVTGITSTTIDRQVASTHYVNLAGQHSAQPFDGVNIVVTTYTDGTTTTAKVIK